MKKQLSNGVVSPNWPLLALLAIVPLQSLYLEKIPSLGGGLNLLNILVLLAFITWRSKKELAQPTVTELNRLVLGFALIMCFGLVMHTFTFGGLDLGTVQRLKDALIPYLVFFMVLNSVRDRETLWKTVLVTWIPLPMMFVVFAAQFADVSSWHYSDAMRGVTSTFRSVGSNETAAFFGGYLLIILGIAYFAEKPGVKLTCGILASLSGYCLLFSYSRGAWLSFVVALGAMIWHVNRKMTLVMLPILLLFGGALLPFLPVSVQERVTTIFVDDENRRDESAASRYVFWGYAMDEFKKSPLVGRGYQTFVRLNPLKMDAHSYYMTLLAELGLIGFICFIAILWKAYKVSNALYTQAKEPLYRGLAIGMIGCVACFAIGNAFGDRISYYAVATYFWTYLALVLRARKLIEEPELEYQGDSRAPKVRLANLNH